MRYSENDHDPFGMLLVDRTWQFTTTYKYGFNGQEQDDEVYGNGNLNTALFWEYDSRLGRRWNLDPVVKPFISSFAVFSCNPIFKIDPLGDDDYFDTDGNYLGTDRNGSHLIKVISKEELKKIIYTNTLNKTIDPASIKNFTFLADFEYSKSTVAGRFNIYRLVKITKHYTGLNVSTKEYENELSPASTLDGDISIHLIDGKIHKSLNNYYNIKSTISDHEKLHRDDQNDNVKITYKRHAEIYIYEISQSNFGLSNDKESQLGGIASTVNFAVNSFFQETGSYAIETWQNKINDALKSSGVNMSVIINAGNTFRSTSYMIIDNETGASTTRVVPKKTNPN